MVEAVVEGFVRSHNENYVITVTLTMKYCSNNKLTVDNDILLR
jgi:hypothetical protein